MARWEMLNLSGELHPASRRRSREDRGESCGKRRRAALNDERVMKPETAGPGQLQVDRGLRIESSRALVS